MPLPPRNLVALHLSVHPPLAEVHAAYPMSCYAPVVALLKLSMLETWGIPIMQRMDQVTWLTLACLDDLSADYVISTAVTSCKHVNYDAASVNAVFMHAAAPYLVPMLVPVPPTVPAPRPSSGRRRAVDVTAS